MTQLKECPFCGGKVNIQYESYAKAFAIWHEDKECVFIEPLWIDIEKAKSLTEAYELWNKRSN